MKPADGSEYEKIVADLLTRRGYQVKVLNGSSLHGTDLDVDGVEVEVKGSALHGLRHGKRGFAWLLSRAGKPRGVHGDVVILLAHTKDRDDLFLLPAAVLEDQNYIELAVTGRGEFYKGSKLNLFHNNFEYLDEEIASTKKEMAV